jgi:hypothetical protein
VIEIVQFDDSTFEEAYELLPGLDGAGISKEVWRRLLRPQWPVWNCRTIRLKSGHT